MNSHDFDDDNSARIKAKKTHMKCFRFSHIVRQDIRQTNFVLTSQSRQEQMKRRKKTDEVNLK